MKIFKLKTTMTKVNSYMYAFNRSPDRSGEKINKL